VASLSMARRMNTVVPRGGGGGGRRERAAYPGPEGSPVPAVRRGQAVARRAFTSPGRPRPACKGARLWDVGVRERTVAYGRRMSADHHARRRSDEEAPGAGRRVRPACSAGWRPDPREARARVPHAGVRVGRVDAAAPAPRGPDRVRRRDGARVRARLRYRSGNVRPPAGSRAAASGTCPSCRPPATGFVELARARASAYGSAAWRAASSTSGER
jgi:hypothetical protein